MMTVDINRCKRMPTLRKTAKGEMMRISLRTESLTGIICAVPVARGVASRLGVADKAETITESGEVEIAKSLLAGAGLLGYVVCTNVRVSVCVVFPTELSMVYGLVPLDVMTVPL